MNCLYLLTVSEVLGYDAPEEPYDLSWKGYIGILITFLVFGIGIACIVGGPNG